MLGYPSNGDVFLEFASGNIASLVIILFSSRLVNKYYLFSSTFDVRKPEWNIVSKLTMYVHGYQTLKKCYALKNAVSLLTASSSADFQQITTTTVTFQPRETGSKSVFITSSDADTRVLTSTATVTILYDDCKCFCYSQFSYGNIVTYHPEYRNILDFENV